MTEMFYKVIDGSGAMSLSCGKLKQEYVAAPFPPYNCRNKWRLLAKSTKDFRITLPTENSVPDSLKNGRRYYNNVLLVNAYDCNNYLFIQEKFIVKYNNYCPTCGQKRF